MSVFGNFPAGEVVDAAERFIAKMDDRELTDAVVRSERAMTPAGRTALVESIFDAFRERGESSEDAAEGAGVPLSSIEAGESESIAALLRYAQASPGLLKEATARFVEHHADYVGQLAPAIVDGISMKLHAR
ncbi:MAG TPA: hypothetical protein VIG32_04900 [Candidatus Baltobacteraceae bacterium]|jgi:hypothetical protein